MTHARVGWQFTLNNYTSEHIQQLRDLYNPEDGSCNVKYLIFGYELAPTTGTPHLQGYIHLSKKIRPNQVLALLPGHPHIEGANGSPKQNRTYCTKPETKDPNATEPFEEFGTVPGGQGSRTDLNGAVELVTSGKRLRDVAQEFPLAVVKFHRGLRVLQAFQPRETRALPRLQVFWGETRQGKSFRCRQLAEQEFEDSDIYCHRGGKWWDGYDGEKCVIFNDFTGSDISVKEWNKVFDEQPHWVETKGGSTWLEFTTCYISSNFPPSMWWPHVSLGRVRSAHERITSCNYVGTVSGNKYDVPILKEHEPATVPPEAAAWMQELQPGINLGPPGSTMLQLATSYSYKPPFGGL
jgi:hypothetical protein